MDGVSSAFAVVSLAIQLVETGEKISEFLSNVQDAPSEVIKLGQTVDQLNNTLKQVSSLLEQQYLILRLPGSPVFITNALENCEKRVKALDDVIQKAKAAMGHRSRVHRSWAAMRFVSRKEDIREMQSQLRDAEAALQTAMLSNSWQLHMHSLSIASTRASQAGTSKDTSLLEPPDRVSQREKTQSSSFSLRGTAGPTIQETSLVWYRGLFGSVDVKSKSTSLSSSNTRRPRNKAISEEKIIRIKPILLRKIIELRFTSSFGQISRTLSTYPILEWGAPIYHLCMNGDLEGLKAALSSGTVSPFVVDPWGRSLLHYAAWFHKVEMCAFLLHVGVDSNRTDVAGDKAMVYVSWGLNRQGEKEPVDTLRLLTRSPNDISSRDIFKFWVQFRGSVEVMDFMFSQDLVSSESDVPDGEDVFPALATALGAYGNQPSQWERIIRLLLRKGAGLHLPVPRREPIQELNNRLAFLYPCELLEYGTPLDELFWKTKKPCEGEVAANRWLQILSGEGYDVVTYLEDEFALHAQQLQLTYPYQGFSSTHYEAPRQLVFHWGSNPSVSWNFWIDPTSSIPHVREEFECVESPFCDLDLPWYKNKDSSPIRSSAWVDEDLVYDASPNLQLPVVYKLSLNRADRRMEKKSTKAAPARGLEKGAQMPGAWPA